MDNAPNPRRLGRTTMKAARDFDRRARAFVLDLGTGGLGVVRSLGEAGIPMTGLDWDHWTPAAKSRYCDARRCPNPSTEPEALLEVFLAEGRRLDRPGVLLPCSDAFVLFISRHRAQLAPYFHFALPAADVMEALVNKRLQYALAERVGTPYPQTFYVQGLDDLARIRHAVRYPAIIKPAYSHLWRPARGNKAIAVADPVELEERFAEVASLGFDLLIQTVVPGADSDFFHAHAYLDASHEVLAFLTTRRIRQYPPDFGTSTLVESVHDAEVARLGLHFLRQIGYHGPASVLFKRDRASGEPTLIECNPRFWGHIRHSTVCGINLPLIAYLELTGQAPPPQRDSAYPAGVRWVDTVGDLKSAWAYFRRRELGPLGWVQSLAGVRVTAHFDWRDPAPFFAANRFGLRYGRVLLDIARDLRARPDHGR